MTSHMDAHADGGRRHPSVPHTAAVKGGGLFVVDVWDAPESFGRFAERAFPAAAGGHAAVRAAVPAGLQPITGRTRASV